MKYLIYTEKTEFVITTTIHELAHHITNTRYHECSHNKLFYKTLKELLTTAVKMGYVDYDKAREKEDSRDIIQMEKHFGKITEKYDPAMDPNQNYSMIKVGKSFNIKDTLKERGYEYNGQEKVWQKKIHNDEAGDEKEHIISLDDSVEVIVTPYNEINIKVYYYIIPSGNTFPIKDKLMEMGYRFNGYYQKNNKWIKKVEGSELQNEKNKLAALGYKCTVKNKL